jgi:hypothetical protein
MGTVEVTAERVWQCGTYLNSEVWGDFNGAIRDQAGLQGCNKDGFTGLISPLQGTMDTVHGWADDLVDTAIDRLHGVSGGLISTAYSYVGIDEHNRDRINDAPDNKRPHDSEPDAGSGVEFSTAGSPFRNKTEVAPTEIIPGEESITESMEGKTRGSVEADAINWVVRNFSKALGLGDRDLRQIVIEPLSGDYNRVRANGEAWTDVGKMLDAILINLGDNAKRLVTSDWTGDAASAFLDHVDVIWAGGLYVASKCAGWLGQGYDRLAHIVLRIARKCARIFDDLIDKIVDVGKRFVPVVGQIAMVVEWVVSGFEDFPFWDDIWDIKRMIEDILTLQETIKDLVTATQNYVNGFEQAVAAMKSIPQIDSVDGAAAAAKEFREGREKMRQARADFDKNAGKFQDQLEDMSAKEPK